MKKAVTILLLALAGTLLFTVVPSAAIIGLSLLIYQKAPVTRYDDITRYAEYVNISDPYDKWEMDESIFPSDITPDMTVTDFYMIEYDPWDAQYITFLEVSYPASDYGAEVSRLESYPSTDYLGIYGASGFSHYTLLAMYADPYNGFVYALTDGHSKVIYVEIIFCNYFMDLDYPQYIKEEYLPDGFDATPDNAYAQSHKP